MSDWATHLEDLHAEGITAFGEPVTLPGGGTALGVFDPGQAPGAWGSEEGLSARLSQQPSPVVALLDSVAAGLSDGESLTVRGQAYLITRRDPDGHGLTQVSLMPDRGAYDTDARWQ